MLINKQDSKEKRNSNDCTVHEYDYPCELFSFATAFIDGRYPETKKCTNLECDEIYYVISGNGIVHSEKGDFELSQGDLYLFEKGEVYWVEGNKLELVLVNAPKWSSEQYEEVE